MKTLPTGSPKALERINKYADSQREMYKLFVLHKLETWTDEEIEDKVMEDMFVEAEAIEWEKKQIERDNEVYGTNYESEAGYYSPDSSKKLSPIEKEIERLEDEAYQYKCIVKKFKTGNYPPEDKDFYLKLIPAIQKVLKYYKEKIEKMCS